MVPTDLFAKAPDHLEEACLQVNRNAFNVGSKKTTGLSSPATLSLHGPTRDLLPTKSRSLVQRDI